MPETGMLEREEFSLPAQSFQGGALKKSFFSLIDVVKDLRFTHEKSAVDPARVLEELGAEIMQDSMILGDNAYDVVPGFVGAPSGSFEEHVRSRPECAAFSGDEDLLTLHLVGAR